MRSETILNKFKKLRFGNLSFGIILLLVISYLLYLFFSLTSGSRKFPTVTEIYFVDNISPAHEVIISKFNEKYKHSIKVIPIDLPFNKFSTNERKELLIRYLRSKSNRIDLVALDLIWIDRFANWAEPLAPYLPDSIYNNLFERALESCYVDSNLVALPFYFDIGIMYYRKDLLQKIDKSGELEKKLKKSITWKEFISLKEKMGGIQNPFYIFPADNYEGLICSYFELILNLDRDYFNSGPITFNTPVAKKALRLLVDLVNKYNMSPPAITEFKENDCYTYFIENDGVFLRGWPSFSKDYKNFTKNSGKEEYLEQAALPHFEGTAPTSIYGGWNLMLSKYSENKEETIEFMKFIVSEESQKILYEQGSYFPVIKRFYENPEMIKSYPELQYNYLLMQNGVFRPLLKDYTRISDIVSYFVKKAILKKLTVEEALFEATEAVNSSKPFLFR